jgi:hypothetical protein
MLPLHQDLLDYFEVPNPMDVIELCGVVGPWYEGMRPGEATAKRNARMAGAARVLLGWAFPEESLTPKPYFMSNGKSNGNGSGLSNTSYSLEEQSQREAYRLAKMSIEGMVELVLQLHGDGSVVHASTSVLALGGGLMTSPGYRGLLLDGLREAGVVFSRVSVVADAAGEGAKGLANVEWGL